MGPAGAEIMGSDETDLAASGGAMLLAVAAMEFAGDFAEEVMLIGVDGTGFGGSCEEIADSVRIKK